MHFNGSTWKMIDELNIPGNIYNAVAVKGNIACAVGFDGQKAVISILKK